MGGLNYTRMRNDDVARDTRRNEADSYQACEELNKMEREKGSGLTWTPFGKAPKREFKPQKQKVKMSDPYKRGKKLFTQHKYRDGFIVWNWEKEKWDYFAEEMV